MRICDKCRVNPIETTLFDKKYNVEIDLCRDCRALFADWAFTLERKKEYDQVEPDKKNTPRRNK